MGTSLTGTKPKDTYDSLIKVGDNGPISGTAKYLSDGLGNDLPIAVSTSAVGIGTSSPNAPLEVQADSGGTSIRVKGRAAANSGTIRFFNNSSSTQLAKIESSDNSFEIGSVNNVYTAFLTNGTERMRILAAGGLTFNGDTSQANALDDYEEGTFTPTVVGGATYDYQSGRYTKIGRMVQFEIAIGWSAGAGSGSLILGGLPFTSASSSTYPSLSISYFNGITLAAAGNVPMANVGNATTTIGFNQIPSGGGSNTAISYSASGNIQISGTYSV